MALVSLANLVGIQRGSALDGDAGRWRSVTPSINVAPAQCDAARGPAETLQGGSDMLKCIRTTGAERESAVHPDDLANIGEAAPTAAVLSSCEYISRCRNVPRVLAGPRAE